MLKIEKTVLPSPEQWGIIIEGMRNPLNSWDKMDSSCFCYNSGNVQDWGDIPRYKMNLGMNDLDLMIRLAKGGAVHAKYRRMIPVFLTINAPLYWWKEFDTYKVGTVANSCSTMHKIHAKKFEMSDFSVELVEGLEARMAVESVINALNRARDEYLSYEVLVNIYHSRKNHKLDEWHTFCDWIRGLPYSELITGGE